MSADAVEKNEYLLTIRIKMMAFDDAAARAMAKDELVNLGITEEEMEGVKFQRLKKDGAPVKVEL